MEKIEFINLSHLNSSNLIANTGFKIEETDKGFQYKNKKFKWGEGLVQFVNYDFSKYFKMINQIKNCYINQDTVQLREFFKPLLQFNSDSLHIQLLQEYLINFFNLYDEVDFTNYIDNSSSTKLHSVEDLINILNNNFITPIKILQENYKSILENYYPVSKLNDITINKINDNLNYTNSLYQIRPYQKILKRGSSNNPQYILVFYMLDEFCRYEFFKVLENNIIIRNCPYCHKYFFQNQKGQIYCQDKCRKDFNNKTYRSNIFSNEYNKAYKRIQYKFKYQYKFKGNIKLFNELIYLLKNLYNEYKDKEPTDENIKAFVFAINKIEQKN